MARVKNESVVKISEDSINESSEKFGIEIEESTSNEMIDDSLKISENEDSNNSAVDRQRIGIMMSKFAYSIEYAPGSVYKHFNTYSPGQIIFSLQEINDLLSMGAPLKVFIEDVSN